MARKNYVIGLEEALKRRAAEIKSLQDEIKGYEELNLSLSAYLFCAVENKGKIEIDRKKCNSYISRGIKIEMTEDKFILSAGK